MVRLSPLSACEPGLIVRMLVEAYAALLAELPTKKHEELLADWRLYDAAVHDEPDSVGSAGFITCLAGENIGFGSWDPRGWPDIGQIGHNCIRPSHRRQGHGKQQVEEILRFFRENGFLRARVRTDEHAFFAPARRMYTACGFSEVGREPGTLVGGFGTIVYELSLRPRCNQQS